jgi:hypothetical protein
MMMNGMKFNQYVEPLYQGRWKFANRLYRFHFKPYRPTRCLALIVARTIAVVLTTLAVTIDTLVFSDKFPPTGHVRLLLLGSNSVLYEVAAMIYASGAAVFGTTFDAYFLIFFSGANCYLTHKYCQMETLNVDSILWIFRVLFFFIYIELAHRNFKMLKNYWSAYENSSRAMLLQTIFFAFTVLFLISPGWRTVYLNIVLQPPTCSYRISECGIADLYDPEFTPGDACESDFISYLAGREELRIVRALVHVHIALYSIYNAPLLTIGKGVTFTKRRLVLLCLLCLLLSSVLWSNVTPFGFVQPYISFLNAKFCYDILEALIYFAIGGILTYNLRSCRRPYITNISGDDTNRKNDDMDHNPCILLRGL